MIELRAGLMMGYRHNRPECFDLPSYGQLTCHTWSRKTPFTVAMIFANHMTNKWLHKPMRELYRCLWPPPPRERKALPYCCKPIPDILAGLLAPIMPFRRTVRWRWFSLSPHIERDSNKEC